MTEKLKDPREVLIEVTRELVEEHGIRAQEFYAPQEVRDSALNLVRDLVDKDGIRAREIYGPREGEFGFSDLAETPDRSLQVLLREVPADKLLLAMKGEGVDLHQKIFRNMSSRAAEMMQDDLETMGFVSIDVVSEAQKEIVRVALDLAACEKILLSRGEEEALVDDPEGEKDEPVEPISKPLVGRSEIWSFLLGAGLVVSGLLIWV